MIGPVTPFNSGIARHTTALAGELARCADVEVFAVSFSRLYPSLLYPGASDRNPEETAPQGIDTDFCLDTLNPLTWRAAAAKILRRKPDLAVIPAWTFFVAPCLGFVARALRQRGVQVVTVVHNAEDHEAAWWKSRLSQFQLRQSSRLVAHSAAIARDLRRLTPELPVTIRPHPVYDTYPLPRGDLPRRAGLELLFFGLIRPYKGLDIALRALRDSARADVRLTVAGEFWQGQAETRALIGELGLDDAVELVPRHVSDQEAAEYFARCDAVIAPYRSVTSSAVVALAQWYGRPVIASDLPGLSEAVAAGETGWLFPAGDIRALADILAGEVSRGAAAAMGPAIRALHAERSWARLADAVLTLDASSR